MGQNYSGDVVVSIDKTLYIFNHKCLVRTPDEKIEVNIEGIAYTYDKLCIIFILGIIMGVTEIASPLPPHLSANIIVFKYVLYRCFIPSEEQ